jgi:hypothetical protein
VTKLKCIDTDFLMRNFLRTNISVNYIPFESRVKIHYNSLVLNYCIEETDTKSYVISVKYIPFESRVKIHYNSLVLNYCI